MGTAQTTDPLRPLGFLVGIWTSEDRTGLPETTEFDWSEKQGTRTLVGRHWTGDDGGCPWCVTQAAILIYFDKDSNQVHAHFRDKEQRSLDFVMAAALEDSVEFFSVANPGMPVFRLTFKRSSPKNISIAVEEASARDGVFSPVFDWSLHRRPLLGPAAPSEIQ
jgi:hypothetical protein